MFVFRKVWSYFLGKFFEDTKRRSFSSEQDSSIKEENDVFFPKERKIPKPKVKYLSKIDSIDVSLVSNNDANVLRKIMSSHISNQLYREPLFDKEATIYHCDLSSDTLGLIAMLNHDIFSVYGKGFMIIDKPEQDKEIEDFFSKIEKTINYYLFSTFKCVGVDAIEKQKGTSLKLWTKSTENGREITKFHYSVTKGGLTYAISFKCEE